MSFEHDPPYGSKFGFYPTTFTRMTASEPNVQNLPKGLFETGSIEVGVHGDEAPTSGTSPEGASRGEGHTGPCAASRTHYDEGPLQPDDAARIDAAWARHLAAAAEAGAYAELRKLSNKWKLRNMQRGCKCRPDAAGVYK